jgi:hypothetical protein
MARFDELYWLKVISRTDWYLEFVPYARKAAEELGKGTEELNTFHKTVRHFFEKAIQNGQVALGDHGPNLDNERRPIDTVVIHHTSAKPGYRLSYMNATQLLNVYAPHFANPNEHEKSLKGQPIWSNHLQNGKPVFYLYHWLMRMDGSFERLLDDSQIGWHAGNWEVNKRSVAICLDNDYEKQDPTDELLQTLAKHIKVRYPTVKKIIGHCEANRKTICPGTNFKSVWKATLLNNL